MYNNNLWVELKKHLKESTLQALIAQQNPDVWIQITIINGRS